MWTTARLGEALARTAAAAKAARLAGALEEAIAEELLLGLRGGGAARQAALVATSRQSQALRPCSRRPRPL